MILTTEIQFKNKKGELVTISIENLSKGSNRKIMVKCDYCLKEREISYKEYNNNIKSNNKYACCQSCGLSKSKENNLIKYGVEYTTQLSVVKEKTKATLLKKYGVEHVSHILEVKELKKNITLSDENKLKISESHKNRDKSDIESSIKKRKETNKFKYGVENISELESIKEKKKNTVTENYGGFTYQSDELMEKVKKTLILRYGTENIMSLDVIKDKIKDTNLEKYGVEYASQNTVIRNKINVTIMDKYGTSNIMHSDIFKKTQQENSKLLFSKKYNVNIKEYNGIMLKNVCNICNNLYEISYNLMKNRHISNVQLCTICNPIGSFSSGKEDKLLDFIKENYDDSIIISDRKILTGKELDIYLPELELAFEFNGLYWHNELYKDKNYHLNKTESCLEKDIQLIHIWEDDWDYKQEIVKSMILNKLKVNKEKIFARKCEIKEINDNKLVKEFLNKNHIQGFVGSSIKLGLYFNDELVSLMTFGKKRKFMNSSSMIGEYELLRFCNKLNTNVIGGASKLFTYFIKNYSFTEITTYADRSHSNGKLYKILGFTFVSKTSPNYHYIIDDIRKHRFGFRKDVLVKEGFDTNKTEHEIMIERGIKKIYDSGSLKFSFK